MNYFINGTVTLTGHFRTPYFYPCEQVDSRLGKNILLLGLDAKSFDATKFDVIIHCHPTISVIVPEKTIVLYNSKMLMKSMMENAGIITQRIFHQIPAVTISYMNMVQEYEKKLFDARMQRLLMMKKVLYIRQQGLNPQISMKRLVSLEREHKHPRHELYSDLHRMVDGEFQTLAMNILAQYPNIHLLGEGPFSDEFRAYIPEADMKTAEEILFVEMVPSRLVLPTNIRHIVDMWKLFSWPPEITVTALKCM